MHDFFLYLLLALTGLVAGFVNTLAGGGSFLTLPALIYLFGLPPQIANATNRFSVIFYTATSSSVFLKHNLTDKSLFLKLLVPSAAGAVAGAYLAVYLPQNMFQFVFGLAMIAMAFTLAFKPKILLEAKHNTRPGPLKEFIVFFLIGAYAGFMQAGVGLLLIAGVAIFHAKDLVKANAIKVTLAFCFALFSVIIFALHHQIEYGKGAALTLGATIGAFIGAKLAIKKGAQIILPFVIAIAVLTGINLIYRAFTAM